MDDKKNEGAVKSSSESEVVKFCPICGAKMYQAVQFGMLFWICPEGDYDEPI
ncbi:hypothetical protein [Kluyvera sp. CHPC 1.251]|uniref:hypothetical protein n=1 Tax=Kluyvera sp. CHPC 1.251 TaxID=2995175 RepID=UPI002FD7BEDB